MPDQAVGDDLTPICPQYQYSAPRNRTNCRKTTTTTTVTVSYFGQKYSIKTNKVIKDKKMLDNC